MKILHSADWHLDSPFSHLSPEQAAFLRQEQLKLPGKIAAIARRETCDLMLLSGDLFDGMPTKESVHALQHALEDMGIPVFITPGNHDFANPLSPWITERWSENVHIFTQNCIESVALPNLDCRIYGAAFSGPYEEALLEGFRADCSEGYAVGILHGDPTQKASPYCPVSSEQVRDSGLDYLALGHIHKGGSFRSGAALCAWPGCPMGRGFDELDDKGVLIVTLEESAQCRFLPLDTPRFYDLEAAAGTNASAALSDLLPPVGNTDFYRITFTGDSEPLDLPQLAKQFSHFPNLQLRDNTLPPLDIWGSVGEDTLEGVYFGLLRAALEGQDAKTAGQIQLAAKISRQILNGQEVALP